MGQTLGCIQVKESTAAMREHCGKFDGSLRPGCHCMPWCFGYSLSGPVSLRVRQLNVKFKTHTKNNVNVQVVTAILFRVLPHKAADSHYSLSAPTVHMQAYVQDVILGTVPKLDRDAAIEEKNGIAKAVREKLEEAMSAYGYEILDVLIVDMTTDVPVETGKK